jgi:hypothetical protein
VQFPIGAVLQHSNTPSLRSPGFEDEDEDDDDEEDENEDENEAPDEWRPRSEYLERSVWIPPVALTSGATFRAPLFYDLTQG